jgi:hypothetical protein
MGVLVRDLKREVRQQAGKIHRLEMELAESKESVWDATMRRVWGMGMARESAAAMSNGQPVMHLVLCSPLCRGLAVAQRGCVVASECRLDDIRRLIQSRAQHSSARGTVPNTGCWPWFAIPKTSLAVKPLIYLRVGDTHH